MAAVATTRIFACRGDTDGREDDTDDGALLRLKSVPPDLVCTSPAQVSHRSAPLMRERSVQLQRITRSPRKPPSRFRCRRGGRWFREVGARWHLSMFAGIHQSCGPLCWCNFALVGDLRQVTGIHMSLRRNNCNHLSQDHARMMPLRLPFCRDTARSMMRILTARATQRLLMQLQVQRGFMLS